MYTIEVNSNDRNDVKKGIAFLQTLLDGINEKMPELAETKEEPKAEEPKAEEVQEGITMDTLLARAKETAKRVGREKVKETISKFAPKLSEVKEDDYGRLYKILGELS